MEWIAALDFEKVANAIVILVTGLLVAFGFRGGRKSAPASHKPAMEVATDIFDAEAIGRLTKEVTGQAVAITAQTSAIAGQTLAMDRHRHALDDLTEQVKELRQALSRR